MTSMAARSLPETLRGPDEQFQSLPTPTARFRFLTSYAILAPSSHNTQPWRFRIADGALDLRADRSRALPIVDPHDRELTISCGAALYCLRLALHRVGWMGEIDLRPDPADPDLMARVRLGDRWTPSDEEVRLFDMLPLRHTNRQAFEARPLPRGLYATLRAAARVEGAWLHIVDEEKERLRIAELVAEGDQRQWSDQRFRNELAAWIHPARANDGLAATALGFNATPNAGVVPFAVRTFNLGRTIAALDHDLATGSPVLATVETERDDAAHWLAAGQALAHVLLRAQLAGVQTSFLSQPIEVDDLRPRLSALLGGGDLPQLLLRLGYGPAAPAAPRRPLDEIIDEG